MPPINDDFANATDLGSATSGEVTFDITGATLETGEYDGTAGSGHTVWFTWTAPTDGTVIFDTADTPAPRWDSYLAAYVGGFGSADLVASDDDGMLQPGVSTPDGYGTSRIAFAATNGTTYHIQVNSYDYAAGGGNPSAGYPRSGCKLRWVVASPPVNDNFVDAIVISGGSGSTTGTNIAATIEASEPTGHGHNSVWWRWTCPASGSYGFDLSGSSFDTYIEIYTGSSLGTLSLVASDDDSGTGTTSLVIFTATVGTTYQIRVQGFNDSATGSINLAWAISIPHPRITDVTNLTRNQNDNVSWAGIKSITGISNRETCLLGDVMILTGINLDSVDSIKLAPYYTDELLGSPATIDNPIIDLPDWTIVDSTHIHLTIGNEAVYGRLFAYNSAGVTDNGYSDFNVLKVLSRTPSAYKSGIDNGLEQIFVDKHRTDPGHTADWFGKSYQVVQNVSGVTSTYINYNGLLNAMNFEYQNFNLAPTTPPGPSSINFPGQAIFDIGNFLTDLRSLILPLGDSAPNWETINHDNPTFPFNYKNDPELETPGLRGYPQVFEYDPDSDPYVKDIPYKVFLQGSNATQVGTASVANQDATNDPDPTGVTRTAQEAVTIDYIKMDTSTVDIQLYDPATGDGLVNNLPFLPSDAAAATPRFSISFYSDPYTFVVNGPLFTPQASWSSTVRAHSSQYDFQQPYGAPEVPGLDGEISGAGLGYIHLSDFDANGLLLFAVVDSEYTSPLYGDDGLGHNIQTFVAGSNEVKTQFNLRYVGPRYRYYYLKFAPKPVIGTLKNVRNRFSQGPLTS